MNGTKKAAVYLGAAGACVLFALLYFREHTRALHSNTLVFTYLGLALAAGLVLILRVLFDLKSFFSGRVERWMVQGAASAQTSPELEEAQRLRASGDPLEAIRLLREYLQANPYELHVMARIAEIYRYDLNNDLAAALEYEELLKHKLPDDQWAWSALHLAKLYGRLNELEKSIALLERLDDAYGHTIAGRRAKKALESMRDNDGKGLEEDGPKEEGATG